MLMNPPPTGVSATPLPSPSPVNRQMIQSQTMPGLQSKPVLGRGTGLGTMAPSSMAPMMGQMGGSGVMGAQIGGTGGMGGVNPMAANNPALMQLLGH